MPSTTSGIEAACGSATTGCHGGHSRSLGWLNGREGMNGGFSSFPKTSSQTFMQQALIAELLQQADNGSLSSSSNLRPSYTRSTPHTVVVQEMSEERPHSATSMKDEAEEGQQEGNEEIGASCHGEDSESDNDEVGALPVRRPGKPGRKYPTRTELNRAAQFRYRQRQKVQAALRS